MAKKKTLNAKRLTKQQVHELIASAERLHQEFTDFFAETYSTGYQNQPQVYELANDRFLFVFDPKGVDLPGKGDIYSREYFLRMVRWHQKVRDDYANGRNSSVEHWRYYSKHRTQLVSAIDALLGELARELNISPDQLNFSYKSLDILSSKAEDRGLEKIQAQLYDHIVAYVGEVLRRRVEGDWVVEGSDPNSEYPAIGARAGVLMPINVVWQELSGLEPMNLRLATANEVRQFSLRYR